MLRKDILRWLVALPTITVSIEASNDTIPLRCKSVCASTVSIVQNCEERFESRYDKLECIRAAPNVSTSIIKCEACANQLRNNTRLEVNPAAKGPISEVEAEEEEEKEEGEKEKESTGMP